MTRAHWDWDEQVAWVRFDGGGVPAAARLADAIEQETMYTAGAVTWVRSVGELPDALR